MAARRRQAQPRGGTPLLADPPSPLEQEFANGPGLPELKHAGRLHYRRLFLPLGKLGGLDAIGVNPGEPLPILVEDRHLPVAVLAPLVFAELTLFSFFHVASHLRCRTLGTPGTMASQPSERKYQVREYRRRNGKGSPRLAIGRCLASNGSFGGDRRGDLEPGVGAAVVFVGEGAVRQQGKICAEIEVEDHAKGIDRRDGRIDRLGVGAGQVVGVQDRDFFAELVGGRSVLRTCNIPSGGEARETSGPACRDKKTTTAEATLYY